MSIVCCRDQGHMVECLCQECIQKEVVFIRRSSRIRKRVENSPGKKRINYFKDDTEFIDNPNFGALFLPTKTKKEDIGCFQILIKKIKMWGHNLQSYFKEEDTLFSDWDD